MNEKRTSARNKMLNAFQDILAQSLDALAFGMKEGREEYTAITDLASNIELFYEGLTEIEKLLNTDEKP